MANMWESSPDDGQTLHSVRYRSYQRFFRIRTPADNHDVSSINYMSDPVDFDAIAKIDPGVQGGGSMHLWKALTRGFP